MLGVGDRPGLRALSSGEFLGAALSGLARGALGWVSRRCGRVWAADNNVELVPTPTYASYPNRIESHFGAISEFLVKNADYLDWDACTHAISQHIRYRNQPERRAERLTRRRSHLNLAACPMTFQIQRSETRH